MFKKSFILAALLLSACAGGAGPIDAQKFLGSLDGPKVATMQDSLMDSAHNAEKRGDFKQAAALYEQVLEHHPDNNDTLLALADDYRRDGELEKALFIYDALITKDPAILAAKEGKALALITKGDFDRPVPILEEIMKVDGTRWKTLNALGILFTTRGLNNEAQQYFDEALKYHADSATILNNMGLSQGLDGKYDAAIATLTRASSLCAADTVERKRIDLNMALVFAAGGKLEDARAIAATYLSGSALNNNLGLYAHLAKDDQMAKAYLNMALTDSKVFYEKAWDNLQDISSNSVPSGDPLPAPNVLQVPAVKTTK